MPEINFNLLNPNAELYSGPRVQMDQIAAYEKAKATRQSNMLAQLYAKHYDPQTGGVNYNALIGDAAQSDLAEQIPNIMKEAQAQAQSQAVVEHNKRLAEQEAATAAAKQQDMKQAEMLQHAKESYMRLQNVSTPDQFWAWHLSNPELPGVDKESLSADILQQISTPQGFQQALANSKQALESITGYKPEKVTETEFDKKWKLFKLQYPNGTYEQFEKLSRAPASSTTVNLPPAQTEEQKAHGQQLVSAYNDIKALATTARNQRTTVDIMDKLLTEGFETGFGKEATAKAANILTSLGVKNAADYAGDAQKFQAAVRQNVLDEQMKQKGVQTEGDAQRIEETSARLGNTTEANKFLVAVRRAQQDRAMAQQKFWDSWWTKNKTYEGAEQAWNEGEGGKSIFDTPALKKYSAAQTNNVRSQADAIIGAKR